MTLPINMSTLGLVFIIITIINLSCQSESRHDDNEHQEIQLGHYYFLIPGQIIIEKIDIDEIYDELYKESGITQDALKSAGLLSWENIMFYNADKSIQGAAGLMKMNSSALFDMELGAKNSVSSYLRKANALDDKIDYSNTQLFNNEAILVKGIANLYSRNHSMVINGIYVSDSQGTDQKYFFQLLVVSEDPIVSFNAIQSLNLKYLPYDK